MMQYLFFTVWLTSLSISARFIHVITNGKILLIFNVWVIVYIYSVLCLVTQSCLTLCNPMDSSPPGSSVHRYSLGENTRVGCYALLQWTFPIQGSNPGLPHCRWIFFFFFFYHLSHQRSPRILEWVASPYSRGTSQPKNLTRISCIAGRFLTSWATQEAIYTYVYTHTHTHTHLIQLSIDRYVGCFHILIVVKMMLLLSHFSRVQLCATP